MHLRKELICGLMGEFLNAFGNCLKKFEKNDDVQLAADHMLTVHIINTRKREGRHTFRMFE